MKERIRAVPDIKPPISIFQSFAGWQVTMWSTLCRQQISPTTWRSYDDSLQQRWRLWRRVSDSNIWARNEDVIAGGNAEALRFRVQQRMIPRLPLTGSKYCQRDAMAKSTERMHHQVLGVVCTLFFFVPNRNLASRVALPVGADPTISYRRSSNAFWSPLSVTIVIIYTVNVLDIAH